MSSRKDKYALSPQPLGTGGQAEVYEAKDRQTNAIVALKRVRRTEEDFVARLRREIQVQTALNHRNIMPVLDHSSHYHWYTMPMADKVLGKLPTPIDNQMLLQIVEDCARGLIAAHEKGYIHRDLTPNNILQLNEGGITRWVVSDWGLVRRHGQTTLIRTFPGQSFGTDGFAAPEMYDDAHTADHRADVYSLGRVVAWCLIGRWPIPNIPLVPEGTWRDFVSATTTLDIAQRIQDMNGVLRLLDDVKEALVPPPKKVPLSSAPPLIQRARERPGVEIFNDEAQKFDVFISHVSEDKDDVVRPLAHALQNAGLRVWYDEFELHIGDSLRRKIDRGLVNSRFGIVVLSQAFFKKGWTNYELDGLVTRAVTGEQILLPVWHNISKQEMIEYSPSLADKLARSTSTHTVEEIAAEIADVILGN